MIALQFAPFAPQEEEIDALRAIYDQDFLQAEGAETSYSLCIHSDDSNLSLELSVCICIILIASTGTL